MSDDNLYANLALVRIDRALRQEKRAQSAYKRLHRHQDSLPKRVGPMPRSWVKRRMVLDDEIYFLIVATNHAISARTMMVERGHTDLPDIESASGLKAWRNILEHWDDPGRGNEIHALRHWKSFNSRESEPGLTQGGYGHRLDTMSGVSLKQLRRDLRSLRTAIGTIGLAAWNREWLTPEQAATTIGILVADLPSRAAIDFSDLGEGLRYPRQWVELTRALGTDADWKPDADG